MNQPFLSIIIPVYNVEKYLAECIESVLSETSGFSPDDLEVLLINDGSTDQSPAILSSYAERFPDLLKVCTTPNCGVSHARNYGIDRAAGTYLWFIDSDDYLVPHAVSTILSVLRKAEPDLLLFGHLDENQQNGRRKTILTSFDPSVVVSEDNRLQTIQFQNNRSELARMSPYPWDHIVRRSFWGDTRFPEGIRFEDFPSSFLAGARAEKVCYLPEPLYIYRTHIGFLRKFSKGMLDLPQALDHMRHLFAEHGLAEDYRDVLEFTAVKFCFQRFNQLVITYDPTNRALKLDVVRQYFDYLNATYPDWQKNPLCPSYLNSLQQKLRPLYRSRSGMTLFVYFLTSPLAFPQKVLLDLWYR